MFLLNPQCQSSLFHKAVEKRHNTTLKHGQVLFYGKPNQIPDYYEIFRLAPINICHADCVKTDIEGRWQEMLLTQSKNIELTSLTVPQTQTPAAS